MKSKKIKIILIALFSPIAFFSCVTKPIIPTAEQEAKADYGIEPNTAEISEMVRRYLKVSGYFDPNGAEIEACSQPIKGWIRNYNYEIPSDFTFGYKASCDVNGKNRMGGFIGFKTIEYFIKDGKVVYGELPALANGETPLFTPGSKLVIWGN